MYTLFDTHAHFSDDPKGQLHGAWMQRAKARRVTRVVAVGGSCALNQAAAQVAVAYPDMIRPAIGFDRDQARELNVPDLVEDAVDRLRRSLSSLERLGTTVCAIGETGLDYHYAADTADQQIALFKAQCQLAIEQQLPIIVHSRDADDDTLKVLADYARHPSNRGGVLHCFTGSATFAHDLLDLGFMISFSGILTFRNAEPLRQIAKNIPLDRLLVETDAPFLAPVPHRGKPNEPANVHEVATLLAQLHDMEMPELADRTTRNAERLFGLW